MICFHLETRWIKYLSSIKKASWKILFIISFLIAMDSTFKKINIWFKWHVLLYCETFIQNDSLLSFISYFRRNYSDLMHLYNLYPDILIPLFRRYQNIYSHIQFPDTHSEFKLWHYEWGIHIKEDITSVISFMAGGWVI